MKKISLLLFAVVLSSCGKQRPEPKYQPWRPGPRFTDPMPGPSAPKTPTAPAAPPPRLLPPGKTPPAAAKPVDSETKEIEKHRAFLLKNLEGLEEAVATLPESDVRAKLLADYASMKKKIRNYEAKSLNDMIEYGRAVNADGR